MSYVLYDQLGVTESKKENVPSSNNPVQDSELLPDMACSATSFSDLQIFACHIVTRNV